MSATRGGGTDLEHSVAFVPAVAAVGRLSFAVQPLIGSFSCECGMEVLFSARRVRETVGSRPTTAGGVHGRADAACGEKKQKGAR